MYVALASYVERERVHDTTVVPAGGRRREARPRAKRRGEGGTETIRTCTYMYVSKSSEKSRKVTVPPHRYDKQSRWGNSALEDSHDETDSSR